jgi:hypothetical protein
MVLPIPGHAAPVRYGSALMQAEPVTPREVTIYGGGSSWTLGTLQAEDWYTKKKVVTNEGGRLRVRAVEFYASLGLANGGYAG